MTEGENELTDKYQCSRAPVYTHCCVRVCVCVALSWVCHLLSSAHHQTQRKYFEVLVLRVLVR